MNNYLNTKLIQDNISPEVINSVSDIINLSLDSYYIDPQRYNIKSTRNKNDSTDSDDITEIIKSLTNIVMNNNFSNNVHLNENFNPILFKLIANDQIKELEETIKSNKKININIQDKDGDTPLHISVFLCNINAIKILLNSNANPMLKDKWGQTPLHRLCFCINESNIINIVDIFFNKFVKSNIKTDTSNIFNVVDNFGNTPTHLILKHIIKNNINLNENHIKLIKKVKNLTNKNIKNEDKQTMVDLISLIKKLNNLTNL